MFVALLLVPVWACSGCLTIVRWLPWFDGRWRTLIACSRTSTSLSRQRLLRVLPPMWPWVSCVSRSSIVVVWPISNAAPNCTNGHLGIQNHLYGLGVMAGFLAECPIADECPSRSLFIQEALLCIAPSPSIMGAHSLALRVCVDTKQGSGSDGAMRITWSEQGSTDEDSITHLLWWTYVKSLRNRLLMGLITSSS